MTNEQLEKIQHLGFEVTDTGRNGRIAVSSKEVPDLETLKQLIMIITFDDEIHFWDADWIALTDSGGYFTALRLNEEKAAYRVGNHGWTSGWYIVPIERLAKHIQRNWDKDKDQGLYLNKVLIKPNKRITLKKIYDNLD